MDAATITSLVSNLGFPIVCVGVMFWMQNTKPTPQKANGGQKLSKKTPKLCEI